MIIPTVGTFGDLKAEGLVQPGAWCFYFSCDDADDGGSDDPLLFDGTFPSSPVE